MGYNHEDEDEDEGRGCSDENADDSRVLTVSPVAPLASEKYVAVLRSSTTVGLVPVVAAATTVVVVAAVVVVVAAAADKADTKLTQVSCSTEVRAHNPKIVKKT